MAEPEFVAGNIFEYDLEDIWLNSKVLNDLRKFKNPDKSCQKCSYYYFCNGGCIGYKLNHKGTISAGDPRCPIKKHKDKNKSHMSGK